MIQFGHSILIGVTISYSVLLFPLSSIVKQFCHQPRHLFYLFPQLFTLGLRCCVRGLRCCVRGLRCCVRACSGSGRPGYPGSLVLAPRCAAPPVGQHSLQGSGVSAVVQHRLSCASAQGTVPDQGSNPSPLC